MKQSNSNIKNELVDLIQTLISFDTTTKANSAEVKEALKYVDKYLKHKDLRIVQGEYEGFEYRIYSNFDWSEKSVESDLLMHGHIDVVPGSKEQFIPKISKGRIYGRGALDMKSGLASCIEIFKNHFSADKKIMLIITSDEEIGSKNGTERIFKEYKIKSKFFVTAEGEKDYLIKYKQKGVLWLQMLAYGPGGHSSYPDIVENPIINIYNAYNLLSNNFLTPKKKPADNWYTTISLDKISSGEAYNSIPTSAEAWIDIRFCEPYTSVKVLKQEITKLLSSQNVELNFTMDTEPMLTDENDPSLKKFYGLGKEIFPKLFLYKNSGTNDARFAATAGIPAIAFGPVGDNYHAKDEYVEIDSAIKFYELLSSFLES